MKKELKEELEEAQKTVEGLKEPFKTMAFEKILNSLINESQNKKHKPSPKISNKHKKGDTKRTDEETQKIIQSLNRTEYPLIRKLDKSLDLALYLILEMEKKGYDSLSPSQITEILNKVFRKNIKQPAIAMALMKADEYTHRVPFTIKGGTSFKYKLMEKGEDYIKSIIKNIQQNFEVDLSNAKKK